MPTKRAILEHLTLPDLLAIVATTKLQVRNPRDHDELVAAATRSRKIDLQRFLAGLSRKQLAELCRALRLDASEGGKDALVQRLLAGATRRGPSARLRQSGHSSPDVELGAPSAGLAWGEQESDQERDERPHREAWERADFFLKTAMKKFSKVRSAMGSSAQMSHDGIALATGFIELVFSEKALRALEHDDACEIRGDLPVVASVWASLKAHTREKPAKATLALAKQRVIAAAATEQFDLTREQAQDLASELHGGGDGPFTVALKIAGLIRGCSLRKMQGRVTKAKVEAYVSRPKPFAGLFANINEY